MWFAMLVSLTTPHSDTGGKWFAIFADNCFAVPFTPERFAAELKDDYSRMVTVRDQATLNVVVEAKDDRAWPFFGSKQACERGRAREHLLGIHPDAGL